MCFIVIKYQTIILVFLNGYFLFHFPPNKVVRIQVDAITNVPEIKEAQNMADRFVKYGESYFTFITTPGMSPTNNVAEQAIRFIVIYRHVSQGTRSIDGRNVCEKIWTVIASCAMQNKSVYNFIKQALHSHFNNLDYPSLIPDST